MDLFYYVFDRMVGRHSMPLAIAATFIGIFLAKTNISKKYLDSALTLVVNVTFFLVLAAAVGYLFYPSYFDHVEATVATLGVIFSQGGQIYPTLPDYSLHGMMYGPGLSEIQSVFLRTDLPVILASKIPSVLAIFIALFLLFRILKNNVARGYLLLLVPFGIYLFWIRADPFFLLIVTAALIIATRSESIFAALILGGLAGVASGLKIHAAVYVFAAVIVVWQPRLFSINKLIAFLFGILIVLAVLFIPDQVSLSNYMVIIKLAGKHGLLLKNFLESIFYLIVITLPIVFVLALSREARKEYLMRTIMLVIIEVIVSAIGSKPGSGKHHLIPFIPINAYLLQQVILVAKDRKISLDPLKFGLIALSIGGLIHALNIVRSIQEARPTAAELRLELEKITLLYPDLLLGLADESSYSHVFFSPMLEKKGFHQIDYASYMDLNYSGISDDVFVNALENCKFPYIALPSKGAPFSMHNSFTQKPLFSENVRRIFAARYVKLSEYNHYVIFVCKK